MLFVDVVIIRKATNHIKATPGSTKKTIINNMCYKILKHVGIKKIYYTNEQGEIVLYEE